MPATKKILIAEDSATAAALMARTLAPLGAEIAIATDGEEASQQVTAAPPDLLILDIVMPKVNGFSLCRRIRSDPQLAAMPIIIVSAMNRETDRYWGLKQGADEYLTKPFDPTVLVAKVRGFLDADRA
jgi:twitching motility two-component system response regulator PilH